MCIVITFFTNEKNKLSFYLNPNLIKTQLNHNLCLGLTLSLLLLHHNPSHPPHRDFTFNIKDHHKGQLAWMDGVIEQVLYNPSTQATNNIFFLLLTKFQYNPCKCIFGPTFLGQKFSSTKYFLTKNLFDQKGLLDIFFKPNKPAFLMLR